MFLIFAKYGTDEKVAIHCTGWRKDLIKEKLNEQFGGEWMYVDDCMRDREIIKFNDGQIYKGFEPAQPNNFRYSKAIVPFRIGGGNIDKLG